jgi:hypothetical protein
VQEIGAPLFGRLVALAKDSLDAQLRQDAGFALGYVETPALSAAALGQVLDPHLNLNAALGIMFRQMNDPVTRAGAWRWLEAHRDAVIERLPGDFQGFLASLADPFCSVEERQAFERTLAARLRRTSGGELAVDRTLERIDNCTALRLATGDALSTTLATSAASGASSR